MPEADYLETVRRAGFSEIDVVARHVLASEELEAIRLDRGRIYQPSGRGTGWRKGLVGPCH